MIEILRLCGYTEEEAKHYIYFQNIFNHLQGDAITEYLKTKYEAEAV